MATFDRIRSELSLTPGEEDLIIGADNASSGTVSAARALETIYLAKRINTMVDRLIESNHELAASNEKHAKAMVGLTWALVVVGGLVGIGQIIATALRGP